MKDGWHTKTKKPVQHTVIHELAHATWNNHLDSANAKAATPAVKKLYNAWTRSPENPEDQKNLDSVINKAEEILDEYPDDEFDDLVLWVYDKYNQQQAAEAAK